MRALKRAAEAVITLSNPSKVGLLYARVLYGLVRDGDLDVASVQSGLTSLVGAIGNCDELKALLHRPVFSHRLVSGIMRDILAREELPDVLVRTVITMIEARRGALIPAMAEQFALLVRQEREHPLDITVAQPLTGEQSESLQEALSQATGGVRYFVREHVDPSILGGIVVDVDGYQLDVSVRGRLDRMLKSLAEHPA